MFNCVETVLDWESINDSGPEEHGSIISSCYCYCLSPSAIPHPWKRPLEDPSLTRQAHVATHDWTWFDRLMQSAWLDLFLSLSLSLSLEFYFLCESDMELVFRRGGKIPFNTCQYLLFPSDPPKKKKKKNLLFPPLFFIILFYFYYYINPKCGI